MSTIVKHKITVITGLPTAYRKLLEMPNFKDYDVSHVRMYTTGGDALTGKTLALWQAKTGMPIWEGLGGTEMMHLVTSNTMSDVPMPDSIGKALPGFEIKVVKEDGSTAAPGEVGSMMIKGPTATLYWKPYIQDNKLLKTMKKGIKDGYNMMGDAVLMDKDGFIFFQAREDDMIKSSGFRLAPSEIEDAILRHKAVRDDAVVGIPDEVLGQKVVAMVELEPGQHRLPGTGQRHHQVLPGRAGHVQAAPGSGLHGFHPPDAHRQDPQEGAAEGLFGVPDEVCA